MKDGTIRKEPQAAMMRWSDRTSSMVLDRAYCQTFTDKRIADTHASSAVLLCLSQDNRAEVDAVTEAALRACGRELRPAQDHSFMYGRVFYQGSQIVTHGLAGCGSG